MKERAGGGAPREAAKIRGMFAAIAGRYDLANRVLSLGLDRRWRRLVAREVAARRPGAVLDVATGSGDLALALAGACPEARVVGADFCRPMLEVARRKGGSRVDWVLADALRLPFEEGVFDALTVAFGFRNMEDRVSCLREMGRVLRPGGRLYILDFAMPRGAPGRVYRVYLYKVLPLVAGLLTGRPEAYRYLGASVADFPSGDALLEMMREAGLVACGWRPLAKGIVGLYVGERA